MKALQPKRRYRNEYRRQQGAAQARATRDRIIAAARRCFAADGYPSTTVDAIAREAGVAVPTVYANFPTKLAILQGLIDALKTDPELSRIDQAYRAVTTAKDRLRAGLRYVREYMEHYADVDRIVRSAGSAEPDLVDQWIYGDRTRRQHARQLVASLVAERDLKAGLDEREAVDVLHLLSSAEVFEILVGGSKWKLERYENWLLTTAQALLTGSHPRSDRQEKPV